MPRIFSLGNHNFSSPPVCGDISPITEDLLRTENNPCKDKPEEDICYFKKKLGHQNNVDPIQKGKITNSVEETPNRQVIHRYSGMLRGCQQAMKQLFSELIVIDEDDKEWPVPILYGSQEKAVAYVIQNNVRKDNSLVVDRPILPLLSIMKTSEEVDKTRYTYHHARQLIKQSQEFKPNDVVYSISHGIPMNLTYTLTAWTKYIEDMEQIKEQIYLKFSPVAYINIKGVPWETIVSLDSISSNIDTEPGDKNIRVIKYQFNFTVQTYLPQPITRTKTVLKMTTDYFNSVEPDKMNEVFGRSEIE